MGGWGVSAGVSFSRRSSVFFSFHLVYLVVVKVIKLMELPFQALFPRRASFVYGGEDQYEFLPHNRDPEQLNCHVPPFYLSVIWL